MFVFMESLLFSQRDRKYRISHKDQILRTAKLYHPKILNSTLCHNVTSIRCQNFPACWCIGGGPRVETSVANIGSNTWFINECNVGPLSRWCGFLLGYVFCYDLIS